MSCISSIRSAVPVGDTGPSLPFSAPKVSGSKRRRLRKMAKSDDPKVRAAAAGNPMLPRSVMLDLMFDPSLEVRSWLARNPAISYDLLKYMSLLDRSRTLQAFARWRLDVLES